MNEIHHPLRSIALVVVLITALGTASARSPELNVHHVGEYAAIPWVKPGTPIKPGSREDRLRDMNFSVASVNIHDDMSDEFYKNWNERVKLAAATGNMLLPRVHFWDGADRFKGPMRDVEVYWRRMDEFLGRMDLSLLPGIVLAEENVHYSGRPQVLAELYHRIKGKYDIPVWQWWSPMTAVPGSGGWIPSDGWVVDPYFKPKPEFRRYVRKYLITGVPLVIMPWASQMDLSKTMTAEQWQANDGQLDVAVEFNLPVAFFWCRKTTCYFGGDRGPVKNEIDKINHWVWDYAARAHKLPADYTGLVSADEAQGATLEIGPNRDWKLVYADDFSNTRCVDEAKMSGFRDLVADGKILTARGFRGRGVDASLTYHFAGDFTAGHPRVSLTATTDKKLDGQVELSLSTDGKQWIRQITSTGKDAEKIVCTSGGDARFDSLGEFWARVRLSGKPGTKQNPPVRIDDLRIESRVLPRKGTDVVLRQSSSDSQRLFYEDDFKTEKYRFTTTRTDDEKLEWSEGGVAVRLRPGGSQPSLIWKVSSQRSIKDITVTVNGRANTGNLSTTHYLDVSSDRKIWTKTTSSAEQKCNVSGWANKPLSVDLTAEKAFQGITELYVRLRMHAGAFKEIHPMKSGVVERLRIDATIAGPK